MSRQLSGDFLRYLPSLVIPIGAGTAVMVIFSRLASPDELGTFLLVQALVNSVGYVGGYWLYQAVWRLYASYGLRGEQARFMRVVSILAMASGGTATLITTGLLWVGWLGVELRDLLLTPAALMTCLSVAVGCRMHALQARFEVRRYGVFNAAFAAGRLVFPVLLLAVTGPLPALLWGNALVATVGWMALSRQPGGTQSAPLNGRHFRRIAGEIARFGLPLSASELGVQVLLFSDRYVIGALVGAAAVGIYSTNYSIADKLLIVLRTPLVYATHPQIMYLWAQGDRGAAGRLIQTGSRWLILLGAPLVAFTVVRSQMISGLLLGEAFAGGHAVVPIIVASNLIWALSQYGHVSFELGKQTWIIAASLLGAALLSIVAAVVLTISIGYLGAAAATGIGFGIYAATVFVVSRHCGLFPWRLPVRTLIGALLAAGLAGIVWELVVPRALTRADELLPLLGGGLLGLIVYGLVIARFGEPPPLRETLSTVARPAKPKRGDDPPA